MAQLWLSLSEKTIKKLCQWQLKKYGTRLKLMDDLAPAVNVKAVDHNELEEMRTARFMSEKPNIKRNDDGD